MIKKEVKDVQQNTGFENRKMTLKMIELKDVAVRLSAYADAVKTRTFVRTKTVSNAILAEQVAWQSFWMSVTQQWPATANKNVQWRADNSVIIG